MLSEALIPCTASNFETEVIQSPVIVVVDFWAEWCNPCKMMVPALEQIATEHEACRVVTINVEEEPELAARCGVRNFPSLCFFVNGRLRCRKEGILTKADILRKIEKLTAEL